MKKGLILVPAGVLFLILIALYTKWPFLGGGPVPESTNKQSDCAAVNLSLVAGWEIPVDKGFCEISNEGAVELQNISDQKTILLAPITIAREDGNPIDSKLEDDLNKLGLPKISNEGSTYQLEGEKVKGDKALIVVIEFVNSNDENWARDYFDRIH